MRQRTKSEEFEIYLARMISLREKGYNWTTIGFFLNKDRTTIMSVFKRHANRPDLLKVKPSPVVPTVPAALVSLSVKPRQKGKYDHLFEEYRNPGENYDVYLRRSGQKLVPGWHIME